jgi:hypothetical protein
LPICLLCQQDRKLTKAHLFGEALHKLLPFSADGRTHNAVAYGFGTKTRLRYWEAGASIMKSHPVVLCASCNGGWMAAIEAATRTDVAALARRETMTLTPAQLEPLATWCTVVAALRSRVQITLRPFTPGEALYLRTEGHPSPNVGVWLLDWSDSSTVRRGPTWSDYGHRAGPEDGSGELVLAALGRLCFLVATRDFAGWVEPRLRKLQGGAQAIWPLPDAPLTWPPARSVPVEVLDRIVMPPVENLPDGWRAKQSKETVLQLPGFYETPAPRHLWNPDEVTGYEQTNSV